MANLTEKENPGERILRFLVLEMVAAPLSGRACTEELARPKPSKSSKKENKKRKTHTELAMYKSPMMHQLDLRLGSGGHVVVRLHQIFKLVSFGTKARCKTTGTEGRRFNPS